MTIYNEFAAFYYHGPYRDFSQHILASFPALLQRYKLPNNGTLLDIACGIGDFAVGAAKLGWQVTGLDQSKTMLDFAGKTARNANLHIEWVQEDMRSFDFSEQFDLITCWYDSLNYMLCTNDIASVFQNTHRSLKPGGCFIFDMNTLYSLAVRWQQKPCYIQQDTPELLELHRPSFDEETRIASLHVTGFRKDGVIWVRMDEIHQERGYSTEEITKTLQKTGFRIADVISNLQLFSKPHAESRRIWFIAKRNE